MGGFMAVVAKVAAALQMAQGATAVVVIVVSATTATLLVTAPDRARDDVARTSAPAVAQSASRASPSPAVAVALSAVQPSTDCRTLQAARTATDAALRAAEQSAGQRVQELRQSWRDADQEKVNTVVSGATTKLRGRLGAALAETASLASQATACDGANRIAAATAAKLDAILRGAKVDFDAIVKDASGANVAPAVTPNSNPAPGSGTTPSGPQGNEQRGQRTDAGGNVTK